jgi:hypothetical protein
MKNQGKLPIGFIPIAQFSFNFLLTKMVKKWLFILVPELIFVLGNHMGSLLLTTVLSDSKENICSG